MLKDKITFVLPVKHIASKEVYNYSRVTEHKRITKLLLPSLIKFVDLECIHELIIITPDEEKHLIEALVEEFGFSEHLNIRVYKDSEIATFPNNFWVDGWFKQQMLKMAIYKYVSTPFYMPLDSDLVFTRPVSFSDFVKDGKGVYDTQTYGWFPNWWDCSSKLLGIDFKYELKTPCPSWTPSTMSVDIVRELAKYISDIKGEDWITHLYYNSGWHKGENMPKWTEYCLYWIFAMSKDLFSEYYPEVEWGPIMGDSIWGTDEFISKDKDQFVDTLFYNEGERFVSTIQSTIKHPSVGELIDRVSDKLFTLDDNFLTLKIKNETTRQGHNQQS